MDGAIAHSLDAKERTDDVRLKELAPFNKMILSDSVRKGLQKCNFVYPTVIQATAIPVGKSGLDLLVQSKSGTGKTLIFSTIILEAYRYDVSEPQSLIIAPTREIAVQIESVLNQIGSFCTAFRAVCVIGGLDVIDDRKRLQGAKAVVGTPGRILHLIQNDVLNTSQITLLVLDEADKMYTQSFRQDLQRIQKALPSKRQTIACSATFCDDLDQELAKIMKNPLLISTEDRATLLVGIKQFVLELPEQKTSILEMQSKLDALRDIFGRIPFKQCLIFAGSQLRADSYRNYLEKDGWPCELISGAQDQKTRLEMFKKFREFKTRIILATDLMSRGVDSEHVNLVINLELPTDVVTYLHRIGRAGRFGSHGIAISFVASEKDRCTFTRLVTQVGSGMRALKYPPKEPKEITRDFWDFSNFEEDCKYFGNFGHAPIAPLASHDHISLSDSPENKENLSENIGNSNSSIDTKTFRIDSKDSALHMLDLIVERPASKAQAAPEKLTVDSRYSSSQQLPSSNTIDDASSIAADSLRSSQQDISRYQSVLMHKAAIPTLFEFLVDQTSSSGKDDDVEGNEKKKKKPQIDELFEDYKKAVLKCDDNSPPIETEEKSSEGPQLSAHRLANFKSLLIDKSAQELPKQKATKTTDIYSDYANFNDDDDSTCASQPTTTEEIDKETFILSVATPSNAPDSIEELQNSALDLSNNSYTSGARSIPEAKHFPSPAHNQPPSSIPDVVPPRQVILPMMQPPAKLTVSVGAQFEIAPYRSSDSSSSAENAAPLQPLDLSSAGSETGANGRHSSLSESLESEPDGNDAEAAGDGAGGGGSSGFDEKVTTSASSGIETSEAEQALFVMYDTSSEDEDDSYNYEETLNGDAYIESDDENESETDADSSNKRYRPSTSAAAAKAERAKRGNSRAFADHSSKSSLSHARSNASNSLAYQSAYARWVDDYWNQMSLVQHYVQWYQLLLSQRDSS